MGQKDSEELKDLSELQEITTQSCNSQKHFTKTVTFVGITIVSRVSVPLNSGVNMFCYKVMAVGAGAPEQQFEE